MPGANAPQSGFWGSKILVNFWFMSCNFRSRYARKSFKGSNDADFGLVSKKILSQNNCPMDWGPGPGESGQKKAKHPHLQRYPQRTAKRKPLFSISSRRLAESEDGLDSSLVPSRGKLAHCNLQTRAKILAGARLKGLSLFHLFHLNSSRTLRGPRANFDRVNVDLYTF